MRIPRSLVQFLMLSLLVLMVDRMSIWAAEPDITVSAETGRMRYKIGDPIEFMIHADVPEGTRVMFPGDTLALDPFLIRDRQLRTPEHHEGRTLETLILQLTVYEVGEFEIPGIDVQWEMADGSSGIAKTESLIIRIDSVLKQGEQEPRQTKPPLNAPVRNRFVFGIIAGTLLLSGLIVLTIYFIRKLLRRKIVDSVTSPEPARPPDIVAMESLAALRVSNLLAQGQIKDYFITLAEILKTYIGRRFEFNAPERTTGEIRADMRSLGMDLNVQTDVLHVLDLADMVKFARYLPPDGHCRDALVEVETIVNQTRDRFQELHSNPGAVTDRVPS